MITTVVTAFPVCMYTIFPCFSKEKKKIIIVQEKKNVARPKPRKKERDFLFFSKNKSPSKTRKLFCVECKRNTPDPVDQNELHSLNSHHFHVSAHLAFYRQI